MFPLPVTFPTELLDDGGGLWVVPGGLSRTPTSEDGDGRSHSLTQPRGTCPLWDNSGQ